MVGGMAGRGVARTVGGAARGVQDDAVRYLRDRNVPLTAGQTLGGIAKGVEDRLTSVPLVGDMIRNRRVEGLDAVNRLAFEDAAAPLQRQTNPITAAPTDIGEQGVEQLRRIRQNGYDNAVDGRLATADPQYDNAYQSSVTAARAIPNTGPQVADELNAIVPGYFAPGGIINGQNAQAAIKELRGLRAARQGDALGQRTGQAVRDAEGAITDLFERQSPGFGNDLGAANAVNGNLKTIEKAVQNAGRNDGRFTAAQLDRSAQQSAAKFGGNAATTQRPFFELTKAAQNVLPSSIPDSGTATRLATLALPAALGGAGGGAGYLGGEDGIGATGGAASGLGIAALLALGGTRGSQQMLSKLLADRPDLLVRAGEGIQRNARIGGFIGAPLGLTVGGVGGR
ncbi:MAG: hypothetical protein EOO80_08640 [Oxalobacteraceae bacterium]|nr:MAG: hypothetical protein EOO80_08640 [Oxalobacteraceae bacterium]